MLQHVKKREFFLSSVLISFSGTLDLSKVMQPVQKIY